MRKHWWGWLIVLLIAGWISGATAALTAWVHLPVRLSASTSVCDFEPRSALSSDGSWLASVWIQGRRVNKGCVNRGAAVLRWATTEEAQTGWSNPTLLPLPAGYVSGCFVHADVALNGNLAHLATTVWSPCDQTDADSAIAYYTCDLSAGTCSAATVVVAQAGSANLRFSDVRIALDSQNRPHIVYGRGEHSLAQSKIFYTRDLGSGWEAPLQISSNTETSYRPSIAASNGRIHFVWENHRDYVDGLGRLRQNGDVRYRYCAEAGTCGMIMGYPSPTNLSETTYPVPSIAARDDRVILTWNVCADVDNNPPCEKFYLVYARSNNNGTSFFAQPLEVGTETELRYISLSVRYYAGTDATDTTAGEYATHLNAKVSLDPDGMPHFAWQMKQDNGYVLTTTWAITATNENFSWFQGPSPQFGDGSDNRVYPSLVLMPAEETWAHHLIYMLTWREEDWGRSQIFYDVASPARPTLRLNYTERTSSLPQERAQVITAYVEQENSVGVGNMPVIFTTTLGSFLPAGYGSSQAQLLTDAQGRATLTLYSNQTGTALVHAWVDSISNSQWDVGEPDAVLTQTWVFTGTPSLLASPGPVMGGEWITATVVDHPYTDLSDFERGGEPLPYYLWWCRINAPETPPSQQIGDGFYVDINTWDHALVLQVPADVTGTYRLETHTDSSGDPCDNSATLFAASQVLTATSAYPPVPLITVPAERPYPGGTLVASLRYHGNGVYDVWWCTQSGKYIAQRVANDVPVETPEDELEKMVPVQVPFSVAGLYRLEPHIDSPEATCGNLATRLAFSSLIWPYSRVYLPLVQRAK